MAEQTRFMPLDCHRQWDEAFELISYASDAWLTIDVVPLQ